MSPPEFTPAANFRNDPLAEYINNMYYSNVRSGRYHSGGGYKLSRIEAGSPGFEPEDPHLRDGICELYKLLNRHYQAFPIDNALRTKWGIPRRFASTLVVPTSDLTANDTLRGLQDALDNYPEKSNSSLSAPAVSAPPSDNTTAEFSGLNNYVNIRHVFSGENFKGSDGLWVPTFIKTSSQFESLPNPAGPGSGFAASLAGSSAGSSAASSKRRLESDGGDRGGEGNGGNGEDVKDGGERANKKRKVKVKGSSGVEPGSQPLRRSSRIFDKVAAGNVDL